MGALSDGRFWKVFYCFEDRYYATTFNAASKENIIQMLGICSDFPATFNYGDFDLTHRRKFSDTRPE